MNKYKSISSFVALIVTSLLFLVACATPSVKQRVVMPAKVPQIASAKKLALMQFGGDRDRQFTAKLESYLAGIHVEGKPYFTLVDRELFDTILRERNLQAESGVINPEDSMTLGRLSGVDTVLSGQVSRPSFNSSIYKEDRKSCIVENDEGDCTKYRNYQASCRNDESKFEYSIRAINVETGDIVFIKSYDGRVENSYCADKGESGIAYNDMMAMAMDKAINKMRNDVAPYEVWVTIDLMKEDESGLKGNPAAYQYFENGLKLAGDNLIDAACEQFQFAESAYKESPAVYYNLGVCRELEQNFEEALSLYSQAKVFLFKPDNQIETAIARTKKMKIDSDTLSKQLR